MNCREATYLHTKKKEGDISIRERLTLFLHLVQCGLCKLFFREIDELERKTALFKESTISFSDSRKEEIQATINRETKS